MSFLQVQKNIKKGILSPLYLLYGTETFLIEETIHKLLNKVLTEDQYDFNLSTYELKETPISAAVEEALTIPFMGTHRVVIVRDPQFLTGKDQSKVEHDLKAFENYITNPVPETIFIIVAPYEKLDERKKIVKLLKKEAEVLEATAFSETEMDKWLDGRVKKYDVEITKLGKEKLVQLLGNSLVMIAGEIEKLALYAGSGGVIDETVVQQLVSKTMEQDVFSLVDHVVHRRKKEALQVFYDLLKQKEEPIKILSLLARQFRILYQVKELSTRGYSQQQIAGTLKLHPYVVKLANQQGNLFDEKKLLLFIDELAETDYKIKTGKIEKQLALELFIIKVLGE
ncbi:DNA polymerase III subunit delta [Anaerobacillus isosaccharinicus]|uniref:DNA polymerase III subunit delta n=1 Tax=Anaerobacillus isosaccharinicus TaxID=1532552 RepID=A0A7S7L8D0_9BACI|nr:DNA polymerase III subunit delta [Anaerobacillus isosaccharinicus]MBA5585477.1 DNA polymerase III subunit delta [Anaerobacillus isosaccharinicus]QOY36206.1 DNA polymerase III subunit delta [Anaerobacillus isosaccharinicus]